MVTVEDSQSEPVQLAYFIIGCFTTKHPYQWTIVESFPHTIRSAHRLCVFVGTQQFERTPLLFGLPIYK